MKNFIFTTIILLLLTTGCASKLELGKNVYITPTDSAHLSNCELLGQVEIDVSTMGLWSNNEKLKEIKYRLRDAAASKYPKADTVTHSDLNYNFFSGFDSNVMGTVFNCFHK